MMQMFAIYALQLNTISLFDLIVCISKYDRESQYVCYFLAI